MAMPFFCAIPTNLPIHAPRETSTLPAPARTTSPAGQPNGPIVLKRNPFYKGSRPHGPDQIVYAVNTDLNQSLLEVKNGSKDYDAGGLPTTAHAQLAAQFGTLNRKGRYFVNPLVETDYIALNTSRGSFQNVNVRKAANFAIDRPAMLRQRGAFAGKRTDQILPPGMAGFRDSKTYPIPTPTPAKAKAARRRQGRQGLTTPRPTDGAGHPSLKVLQFDLEPDGPST